MRVMLPRVPAGALLLVVVGSAQACGGSDESTPTRPDASEDAEADVPSPADTHDPDGADTDPPGDATTPPARCGDGVLSPTEACEAFDLRGLRCVDLGFEGGRLSCSSECTLDESLCVRCGDGIRQGDEVCDGTVETTLRCEDLLGPGSTGVVRCASTCDAYDVDGCSEPPIRGDLAPCDPEGVPCADGRTCARTAAGAICVTPCVGADACGADRVCTPVGDGVSMCVPLAREGDACDAALPCREGLTCLSAFEGEGAASVCVRRCGSGCEAGERCIASPSGASEVASSVPCDLANPSTCPEGASCVDEGTGAQPRCLRPISFCAVPRAPYGFTRGGPVDAQLCDFAGPTDGGRFCAGSAPREADFVCYPVFGDESSLGACVGLCDDGGVSGAGDFACGAGWRCGEPELQVLFLPQPGGATCTEGDRSACQDGFPACVDLGDGLVCARSARVCVPEEAP